MHHPCAALYTIIQLGIPSLPAFNNNIHYCKCLVCVVTCEVSMWFQTGLCEGGHPDEGQQEESTAPPFVFGKCCSQFVSYGANTDKVVYLLLIFIFVSSCYRGRVPKTYLCRNSIVRHFGSGLLLCPDWAIKSRVSWPDVSECWLPEPVLYWQQREAQPQLLIKLKHPSAPVNFYDFNSVFNILVLCLQHVRNSALSWVI